MPAYAFEAIDPDGATRKGLLEADSVRAARSQLRAQNLVPLAVVALVSGVPTGDGATPIAPGRAVRRVFGAARLALWTRQLAGLVAAGLPLERALAALADEAEDPPSAHLLAALRADVNAGATFARALARFPRDFPEVFVAVVGAGEHSGHLGLVLERLADDLEEQQALRAKLLGAALYPAIVTCVAMAVVVFLVSYVVPQVAGVFVGSKRTLPWLTLALLGLSGIVRSVGWYLVGATILIAIGTRLALANAVFRLKFDSAWLQLPWLGRLARGYHAARFANTLALLAAAGVPILQALQAAAETLGNRALQADAQDILVLVREGAPLASALGQKKRFPALLAMFARLGEQTGQLPQMLQRAAHQTSAEVQRRALQLATLLEPLLIVVMGAVVMLIVLAVLLPIIELNQLVK